MGRAHALILVLVTALSCAPGVRADLPATTRGGVLGLEDASQARAVDNVDDSTLAALCSCTAQNGLIWRQPESGWLDEFFTGETAGGAFDLPVRGAPNRCEVPALPGSARLFLTAMLSLGAWHLARSVRQFDFGVFPSGITREARFRSGTQLPLILISMPCRLASLRRAPSKLRRGVCGLGWGANRARPARNDLTCARAFRAPLRSLPNPGSYAVEARPKVLRQPVYFELR